MKRHGFFLGLLIPALVLGLTLAAMAETPEELAKESEAAAAASAKTKPTVRQIIDNIEKGCKLLQAEGMSGIRKFQGKDSPFIFGGTYIWIHDLEGNMVMHPIKYKMNGNQVVGLKDAQGKLFFAEMNEVARDKGSGWVSYMWPKPGEKASSKKVSYVKHCRVEGHDLVLGCGVYDITEEDIKAAQ